MIGNMLYAVIDTQTRKMVALLDSFRDARQKANNLDLAYGLTRYTVHPIPNQD